MAVESTWQVSIVGLSALAVVVIDQVSKGHAFSRSLSTWWVRPVMNDGSAWGLFYLPPLQMVALALVTALVAVYGGWRLAMSGRLSAILLGALVGGILSNIVDRIFLGAVRDFLVGPWGGVYNIADVAVAIACLKCAYVVIRALPKGTS